jgi:hypothetical protein
MRVHTTSFCWSDIKTQSATSATVRPHPLQISSKVVEQTATQGVSGRSEGVCIIITQIKTKQAESKISL